VAPPVDLGAERDVEPVALTLAEHRPDAEPRLADIARRGRQAQIQRRRDPGLVIRPDPAAEIGDVGQRGIAGHVDIGLRVGHPAVIGDAGDRERQAAQRAPAERHFERVDAAVADIGGGRKAVHRDRVRLDVVPERIGGRRGEIERAQAWQSVAKPGLDRRDMVVAEPADREFRNGEPARAEAFLVAGEQMESRGRLDREGGGVQEEREPYDAGPPQGGEQHAFAFDEFSRAIMAKIVKKCGRRDYWEDWAGDIAKIAQTHINRIQGLVEKPGTPEREAFENFVAEIRDDLNEAVSEGEAIEMLAQHLITRPVFEALFEGYSFAQNNPVSKALEGVLETLQAHHIDKEAESLQRFYASVRRRAAGIDKDEAKQKIIVELYDKFFRNAFPKMTDRLGIVYTPVEIVDFILKSVNELLQSEFGQTLGSEGVHILDPFTGTGTFITRLIQSGLIKPQELERKYAREIHANEIVLLAYYIAAINIEAAYHGVMGGEYQPFEGICLTDTFQLYEQEKDLLAELMPDNSDRRARQKKLPVRVIIGNPPYSEGQKSENDNAKNLAYPLLDARIRDTYGLRSNATLLKGLFNTYNRAFRWASDRIGSSGIVAFVTASGFLDNKTMDGVRKCFSDEFSSIHVFDLRGDINKNIATQGRAKEGHNIFASGSKSGIAITFLVKNPSATETGRIYYHNIGDNLTVSEKKAAVERFSGIGGLREANAWQSIIPNDHGDWLRQRDASFEGFIALGNKAAPQSALFSNFSQGVLTSRDSWAYNPSHAGLAANMRRMIACYDSEVDRFVGSYGNRDGKTRAAAVDQFIDTDPTRS